MAIIFSLILSTISLIISIYLFYKELENRIYRCEEDINELYDEVAELNSHEEEFEM